MLHLQEGTSGAVLQHLYKKRAHPCGEAGQKSRAVSGLRVMKFPRRWRGNIPLERSSRPLHGDIGIPILFPLESRELAVRPLPARSKMNISLQLRNMIFNLKVKTLPETWGSQLKSQLPSRCLYKPQHTKIL